MKVHIRKRQITSKGSSKPRYTLYLDIYYSKRKRKREFLGIYLEPNDTKTTRLDKLRLAENIKPSWKVVLRLQLGVRLRGAPVGIRTPTHKPSHSRNPTAVGIY